MPGFQEFPGKWAGLIFSSLSVVFKGFHGIGMIIV